MRCRRRAHTACRGRPRGAPAARAELVAAIDALPAAAAPEAFGLHANADVARDCRATEALLGALVAVGAGGAGRGAPRP